MYLYKLGVFNHHAHLVPLSVTKRLPIPLEANSHLLEQDPYQKGWCVGNTPEITKVAPPPPPPTPCKNVYQVPLREKWRNVGKFIFGHVCKGPEDTDQHVSSLVFFG